jgi:hypothetical protein
MGPQEMQKDDVVCVAERMTSDELQLSEKLFERQTGCFKLLSPSPTFATNLLDRNPVCFLARTDEPVAIFRTKVLNEVRD